MCSTPVSLDALQGVDTINSAEETKHLFKNPEAYVSGINEIISTQKLKSGEILELADRIVVMHGGRVAHDMPAVGADPQEIGRHMLGHS